MGVGVAPERWESTREVPNYADTMIGHHEPFPWKGSEAFAWVPSPLVVRDLSLDTRTLTAAKDAARSLTASDAQFPTGWAQLNALLLQAESVGSVRLEDAGRAATPDAAGALRAALEPGPLSFQRLNAWHRLLVPGGGARRETQTWVGGASPVEATYVPPPPPYLEGLMDDLLRFANDESMNAVAQAAVLHGQFDAIQPYLDANGRMGRLLMSWLLKRRGIIDTLPPPISVALGRDLGGYLSGLHLFREGRHQPLITTVSRACQAAARQSDVMVRQALELVDRWNVQASDLRRDSAARRLIPLIATQPLLDSVRAAELIDVSERAARAALHSLAERQILEEVIDDAGDERERGRPRHRYEARELLELTATWVAS